MNFFLKNKHKIKWVLILFIFISFSFLSADCEKVLVNNTNIPQEMVGNWLLIEQTGALQDICADETVTFESNGIATLTCPGSGSITRDFNVENNVLNYTETSISYNIEISTDNQFLSLYGIDVSRNLTYQKIITFNTVSGEPKKANFNNSSEFGR